MSNQFADAFAELHACLEAETGEAQEVTINGTTVDAVVSEISKDEMLVHGGTGEAGGFTVEVAASAFASPAKIQTIVYKTTSLRILSFQKVNEATWRIVAGDFTTNP